jgi:hypothetical protein
MESAALRFGICLGASIAAASLLAAGVAAADDVAQPTDAVPGHPGVTYLDLLTQAVPGLALNPADKAYEAHLQKPLPHIAGRTFQSDAPDPVSVSYFEVQTIHAGGKARLLLLTDLGQAEDSAYGVALLALYDDAPQPKLLDAQDVAVDKDTGFDQRPLLPLTPADDVVVTYSEHFNSDQTYSGRLLILVRDDRLQLIDDIATFSDRFCGYERDEAPVFATRPGRNAAAYPEIDVTVTEALKHTSEDCPDDVIPPTYTRTFHAAYRWDAAKGDYVEGASDLDKLDQENQARY